MKTTGVKALITLSILITTSLCIYQFHFALSNNIADWASFGDYLNGVLSPILAIINIWVFVKLTKAINKDSETQKEKELLHQKKLILAQMRQKELDNFSLIIDNSLNIKYDFFSPNIVRPIVVAITYIDSFFNYKRELFTIINEGDFETKFKNFHTLMCDYYKLMEKHFNAKTPNQSSLNSNGQLTELINCKNEIISELQTFILKEIK